MTLSELLRAAADLMERSRWPHAPTDPAQVLANYVRPAAYGLTRWNEWHAMWHQRRTRDGEGRWQWLEERRAVYAAASDLLFPCAHNSPRVTVGDLRAHADRIDHQGGGRR